MSRPDAKNKWDGIISMPVESNLLSTQSFQFIVGSSQKAFLIHKGILDQLSKPLAMLVGGPMREASNNSVVLEDVEEDTFARFAQFAYTGSYAATTASLIHQDDITSTSDKNNVGPEPAPTPDSTPTGDTESKPQDGDTSPEDNPSDVLPYSFISFIEQDIYDRAIRSSPWRTATNSDCAKVLLMKQFIDHHSSVSTVKQMSNGPKQNPGMTYSPPQRFASACLVHVKLWILADKYVVHSLINHTEERLADVLAHWIVSPSYFVDDFSKLVSYVYHRTGDNSNLREMIVEFAACVANDVVGLESILLQVPEFGVDLFHEMARLLRCRRECCVKNSGQNEGSGT